MNLSEISNDVVEFKSGLKYERTVELDTKSTGTDPLPTSIDSSVAVIETESVAIQTGIGESSSSVQSGRVDEKGIIKFLQSVAPLMEKELLIGLTPVCKMWDADRNESESSLSVQLHQQINVDEHVRAFNSKESVLASAVWLSISMDNAPHFALSIFPVHDNWCEHNTSSVLLFSPTRDRSGQIVYIQSTQLPVKSCVKVFAGLKRNRDIFAAGTVLGDLYIWEISSASKLNPAKLVVSESTKNGEIVAMAWLQSRGTRATLITGHSDGMIFAWKFDESTGLLTIDKAFNLFAKHKNDEIFVITAIEAVSHDGFCVGTDSGRIIFCSVTQLMTIRGTQKQFDPTVQEMETRTKSAIRGLNLVSNSNRTVLLVGDITGNVHYFDVTKLGKKAEAILLFRTLSPFQNKVAISNDLNNIFVLTGSGVEAFSVNSKQNRGINVATRQQVNEFNLIQISDNNQWLLTGVGEGGKMHLYSVKAN